MTVGRTRGPMFRPRHGARHEGAEVALALRAAPRVLRGLRPRDPLPRDVDVRPAGGSAGGRVNRAAAAVRRGGTLMRRHQRSAWIVRRRFRSWPRRSASGTRGCPGSFRSRRRSFTRPASLPRNASWSWEGRGSATGTSRSSVVGARRPGSRCWACSASSAALGAARSAAPGADHAGASRVRLPLASGDRGERAAVSSRTDRAGAGGSTRQSAGGPVRQPRGRAGRPPVVVRVRRGETEPPRCAERQTQEATAGRAPNSSGSACKWCSFHRRPRSRRPSCSVHRRCAGSARNGCGEDWKVPVIVRSSAAQGALARCSISTYETPPPGCHTVVLAVVRRFP